MMAYYKCHGRSQHLFWTVMKTGVLTLADRKQIYLSHVPVYHQFTGYHMCQYKQQITNQPEALKFFIIKEGCIS